MFLGSPAQYPPGLGTEEMSTPLVNVFGRKEIVQFQLQNICLLLILFTITFLSL